jgi:two-component system, NarL family, invasion response regulator UvrY
MKVLLVDDHPIVRQGIKQILSQVRTITDVGEAETAEEAMDKIRHEQWDIIILDINLPDRSGFDLLKELRRAFPELPIVMLTLHAEEQFAVRSLRAGASGYLTKEASPEELIRAVQRAATGRRYISPALAQKVALGWDSGLAQSPHDTLSDREFQVLRMIASGQTATEIAENLLLSVKTISTYRSRILEKLNLQTNAEIIRYAIEHNLVE